jgi:hypothetical protein
MMSFKYEIRRIGYSRDPFETRTLQGVDSIINAIRGVIVEGEGKKMQ